MSIDWDGLVKPLVYVLELVLGAVIVIGTADKLLYTPPDGGGARCALGDSIATCSVVIVIGGLLLLGTFGVLWRRVVAAFSDESFPGIDESGMCGILALGWLIVASVITKQFSMTEQGDLGGRKSTRNVITAFAWMNFFSFIASAVLAAYKPDVEEELALHYANLRQEWHDDTVNLAEGVDIPTGRAGTAQRASAAAPLLSQGHDEYLESLHLRKADMSYAPHEDGVRMQDAADTSVLARDAEIASWGRPRRRNLNGGKEDGIDTPSGPFS